MEMTFVRENEVEALIDRGALVEALRKAFLGLETGSSVQPPQTQFLFPNDAGDCILYAGSSEDLGVYGATVSPFLAANISAGTPPVRPYNFLFSRSDGGLVLIAESLHLTAIRTAATTFLALENLIKPTDTVLTIVGSGMLAREHLKYFKEMRKWEKIYVVSPSLLADNGARLEELQLSIGVDAELQVPNSIEEGIGNADVVLMCTSSEKPVCRLQDFKSDALVSSITTDGLNAHEVPPQILKHADVFCDYKEVAPNFAGEMILMHQDGKWNASEIIADLPELCATPRNGREKFSFFRSVGLGLEDVVATQMLRRN